MRSVCAVPVHAVHRGSGTAGGEDPLAAGCNGVPPTMQPLLEVLGPTWTEAIGPSPALRRGATDSHWPPIQRAEYSVPQARTRPQPPFPSPYARDRLEVSWGPGAGVMGGACRSWAQTRLDVNLSMCSLGHSTYAAFPGGGNPVVHPPVGEPLEQGALVMSRGCPRSKPSTVKAAHDRGVGQRCHPSPGCRPPTLSASTAPASSRAKSTPSGGLRTAFSRQAPLPFSASGPTGIRRRRTRAHA